MHFVSGGAFQGKRKWVCDYYQLNEKVWYRWCNGYKGDYFFPEEEMENVVVFEGMEALIWRLPDREHWAMFFQSWHQWEQNKPGRNVVWIGCDITQGIVPLTEEERNWRDVTGWCYQELTSRCSRVDRLWCGLAERIK
ncbi:MULTISPECIES: bifunctional adenosylcobinamide kinase/adenosylcobinamide-phosphate guanylyltransferase [Anoxybacillus]|uniref:bifunctional adenosylcobinamide kinase/adenosylcobinamide-phosphate guanylyltransferase n=1 Tax=Anoxybacillaceae TaxID=3120669 RepID=UPI0005CCE2D3|nr:MULTISPECIES: bifunctional adenosylcobinamide kinase/adenosylcobinamide-phosphate guanylyltransferase [Anoxybacillus]MBB3906674.1 adenosyl cobinamide kinase/adenosyl cobinamide phosphate guanylyltransferase [Anoxybacillus rupiensis]MBS2770205.1 bifunctional adenosylcobinamide kinase/adenosylcobinamide-phosphate guanylyltransferase [Anoxybacillus rupiensis]